MKIKKKSPMGLFFAALRSLSLAVFLGGSVLEGFEGFDKIA